MTSMSGNPENLSKGDRQQIVDWRVEKNLTPEEMSLKFAREDDISITARTISKYLARDSVQDEIQTMEDIQEKESQYDQEELIRDLKKMKEEMWSYLKEMKDDGHGVTANEAAKNMLKATKQLGDYLDAFDSQSLDANVIKINELNVNNINNIVQQMPTEEKKNVVKQLEEDPEVENFMIQRTQGKVNNSAEVSQR